MCKTIPRGKTKHYRVLLFPEARLNIIECFVIPRGKTKHYRVFWCPRGKTKHYRVFWSEQPRGKTKQYRVFWSTRGKTKHYRVFWSKHLGNLKRKRDVLRNNADQTGRTEDVQAWRRQSASVLRQAILQAKRTSTMASHLAS
ncbi:unnamed protein product [Rodentolepis nana]|uniref:AP2/ERF domain-containing protein n=1 Tax=Rodentolepis nana TaxID=102285 RepID=A0A0R3U0I5_RODNA|nr:unnamed protein product [Rodentolepis nana]